MSGQAAKQGMSGVALNPLSERLMALQPGLEAATRQSPHEQGTPATQPAAPKPHQADRGCCGGTACRATGGQGLGSAIRVHAAPVGWGIAGGAACFAASAFLLVGVQHCCSHGVWGDRERATQLAIDPCALISGPRLDSSGSNYKARCFSAALKGSPVLESIHGSPLSATGAAGSVIHHHPSGGVVVVPVAAGGRAAAAAAAGAAEDGHHAVAYVAAQLAGQAQDVGEATHGAG